MAHLATTTIPNVPNPQQWSCELIVCTTIRWIRFCQFVSGEISIAIDYRCTHNVDHVLSVFPEINLGHCQIDLEGVEPVLGPAVLLTNGCSRVVINHVTPPRAYCHRAAHEMSMSLQFKMFLQVILVSAISCLGPVNFNERAFQEFQPLF